MLVIAARAAIDDDNRDGPRVTRQDLLVLVRTTPVTQALAPEDHVQIDWGDDFAASYQAAFPDQPNAVLSICTAGWRLIVFWRPAAAVFPPGFHRPCLEERRLARYPGNLEYSCSAYVVHSAKADAGVMDRIRGGLRAAAAISA
ncbi:hypothetical protein [uncultured Sphingosinicella sp.]|uniref:hypothetical protein n=1 Tax=uncultured Sphingosinicella sp. TaxID=478748 RepID=UPI0030D7B1A8|tara:strand:+ start:22732 stop:23163 length:432 start_codon:yes stop_codon:yes gene_type:complete